MTAALAQRRTSSAARDGAWTRTGTMLHLALRRDRVKLPAWTFGIALLLPYFSAVAASTAAPTQESLQAAAELVSTPMVQLFAGPSFGLDAVTLQRYLIAAYSVEFLLGAALMNILLITRHTRGEEQSGRAELTRAAVVGRHAPLTAAFLLAALTNIVLALLLTAAAVGVGLPAGSALLFAAGTAATGLVFAAVTAVAAQLTEHARTAAGIAGAALGIAWLFRAVGALHSTGGGPVTWLSPLGWAQLTRVLADERWWPLTLSAASTTVLAAVSYALSSRHDVGAGLVAPRPGRATASPWLRSTFALAVRLQLASYLAWGAALLAAGLVFGSLSRSLGQGLVTDLLGAGPNVLGGYLSLMSVGMAYLVGVFTVLAFIKMRTEETRGRLAFLLSGPTSRRAWLGSALLATTTAAVVLLALAGLGLGIGAALGIGDRGLIAALTAATLARGPEVLVLLAIATALFGFAPRAVDLTWTVLAYGVFVRFWGTDVPDWLADLSPFQHIPRMPLEEFTPTPLMVLSALAAGLALLGLHGFQRRDLRER